jgi:outer membrane protein assembly factor BamB
MNPKFHRLVLIAVRLMVLSAPAAADDWPRWRGPANDGQVAPGAWVPEALPGEPKISWRVKLGDGYGSPVIARGIVFVLDKEEESEVLHAIDAKSGRELWKKVIFLGNDDIQGKGPRSTPLVDGDRVYVQTMRGEFQCLATADGALRWRKNFVDDFGAVFLGEISNPKAIGATRHGNNGAPIIEGDQIIIQAGGLEGASVVCLNKLTGALVWKSESDPAGYAAAVVATVAGVKQVIAFTALGVIGLELGDGRLLWRFPITTTWARHATTPVVVGEMVTVSSHQHGMFGLRVEREGGGLKVTQAW